MMLVSSLILFTSFYISNIKGLHSQTSSSTRVQLYHACVQSTAYIPWPPADALRHGSTTISLIFRHRHSEKDQLIATFKGGRKYGHLRKFSDRLVLSEQRSGVFLRDVNMGDAGLFTARATVADKEVWTKKTELITHVRPMITDNRLNITVAKTARLSGDRKDCVTVKCGKVKYQGYPSVYYVWANATHVLHREKATAESWSTFQVCSPFQGKLTCSLGGFSSICIFDLSASILLDLPGQQGNSSGVQQAGATRDLILMIVMPVLAIGIPLLILGVWVCIHLLKNYPHYRDQRQGHRDASKEMNHVHPPGNSGTSILPPSISFQCHHDLPPPILEDLNETESVATIETTNRLSGLHSPPKQYRDPDQTERKCSPFDGEEDENRDEGNGEDSNEDTDDDDDDDDDEDDDEEEEDEDEDDDGDEDDGIDQDKKERQPLMEGKRILLKMGDSSDEPIIRGQFHDTR